MQKYERFTFDCPPDLRKRLLNYAKAKRIKAAQVLRDYINRLPEQK